MEHLVNATNPKNILQLLHLLFQIKLLELFRNMGPETLLAFGIIKYAHDGPKPFSSYRIRRWLVLWSNAGRCPFNSPGISFFATLDAPVPRSGGAFPRPLNTVAEIIRLLLIKRTPPQCCCRRRRESRGTTSSSSAIRRRRRDDSSLRIIWVGIRRWCCAAPVRNSRIECPDCCLLDCCRRSCTRA